jgi:hypothetical protein
MAGTSAVAIPTAATSSLSMRENSNAYVAWMLAGTATLSVRADPI